MIPKYSQIHYLCLISQQYISWISAYNPYMLHHSLPESMPRCYTVKTSRNVASIHTFCVHIPPKRKIDDVSTVNG